MKKFLSRIQINNQNIFKNKKKFSLIFMNFQIEINSEKKICSKRKIPLKYIFGVIAIKK